MNIHDIFIAVANEGNFAAAAKKLHRTPSSISKQILQLEQTLNTKLFERNTRSMSLTEAGRCYLRHSELIVGQVEKMETELADLSSEPKGMLNVSIAEPLLNSRVMETLSEFAKRYPEIGLTIDVARDHRDFIEDDVDVAFRVGDIGTEDIVAYQVDELSMILCASSELLKRAGKPSDMAGLISLPIAIESNIHNTQKAKTIGLPNAKALIESARYKVGNHQVLLELVSKGVAAGAIFKHLIETELANETLIDLLPGLELPLMPVHMIYPSINYQPKKLRALIDFFKAHSSSLDKAPEQMTMA